MGWSHLGLGDWDSTPGGSRGFSEATCDQPQPQQDSECPSMLGKNKTYFHFFPKPRSDFLYPYKAF